MSKTSVETNDVEIDETNLDSILTEIGGFGRFQIITYILICIPNIISAATYVNFMISATTLDYRCKVPECDIAQTNNRDIAYDQPWLRYAIPTTDGKYDKCFRYAIKNQTTFGLDQCTADMFDNSTKIECTEFIYASDERNVQTEFNVHCTDNYKLALVGTVNSLGRFVALPFTGLLSDRFGRLKVVINGLMMCCLIGIIKSFSVNYLMYLTLEFFESAAGTCTFGGIYVLGLELVSTRYRVVAITLIGLSHPIGEIIFGFLASYCHDFRLLLRIFYAPGLFLFVYFWLVPESIRWLLVTGRVDRAITILKRIARVNKRHLSNKSIDLLVLKYTDVNAVTAKNSIKSGKNTNHKQHSVFHSFGTVFKSRKLALRLFVCCYQWCTCCFCYYGLNLSSTLIPGADRYVGFLFVVAAEVPGILLQLPLLKRFKRRILLFSTLCVAAISIVATSMVPTRYSAVVLIFYMIGKAAMTLAFALLYIFTAEMWPTNLRTSIMNTCSMIGRVGSMISPLTVILGAQYGSLPTFLFAGSAVVAALLVVFNPETHSKKLPDTIEEAKLL